MSDCRTSPRFKWQQFAASARICLLETDWPKSNGLFANDAGRPEAVVQAVFARGTAGGSNSK
ncbi:MAG: hypothetical protein JWQ73_410, partial [Variovorax sp.]|nr:hypothetical protein [Variovorax sp.]